MEIIMQILWNYNFWKKNSNKIGYLSFGGYYTSFEASEKILDNDIILKKLTLIKFGKFFREDYKKKSLNSKEYFDLPCIKYSNGRIGFHQELNIVLYHFLIDCFKEDAEEIRKWVTSIPFETKFDIKISPENPKYIRVRKIYENDVYDYLNNRTKNFKVFSRILSELSDVIVYDENYTDISISKLNSYLDNNRTIYNFDTINLE